MFSLAQHSEPLFLYPADMQRERLSDLIFDAPVTRGYSEIQFRHDMFDNFCRNK